jgi:hypothetical protein
MDKKTKRGLIKWKGNLLKLSGIFGAGFMGTQIGLQGTVESLVAKK